MIPVVTSNDFKKTQDPSTFSTLINIIHLNYFNIFLSNIVMIDYVLPYSNAGPVCGGAGDS
jgi:hypothetical protein